MLIWHAPQQNLSAGSPVQARGRPNLDLVEPSDEILRTETLGTAG
jgi:hypothetical protein